MTVQPDDHPRRLVIRNRPWFSSSATVILAGVVLVMGLRGISESGGAPARDDVVASVIGALFVVAGLGLYRETTTVFDTSRQRIVWRQTGLLVDRRRTLLFRDVQRVIVARGESTESSSTRRVELVLEDARIPLAFGYSGVGDVEGQAKRVRETLEGARKEERHVHC